VEERAYVELWTPSGSEVLKLASERATVGAAPSNDVALPSDLTVSRIHAELERFPAGWCISDLGSTNGTFVNGERIWGTRPLHDRDEIRVGATRMTFRSTAAPDARTTETSGRRPDLTRREREVLLALCRPIASDEPFKEPASNRQIATELVVSEDAVKQHVIRLYRKFGIEDGERRRLRLANAALLSSAVTLADIRSARARPSAR
jgi:DNA-binding CsgD family transcriptional regulator